MIGAIAGDQIGSRFEFNNVVTEDFGPLFTDKSTYTDDTVLTVATADVILNGDVYAEEYLKYAECYPNRGYGGNFAEMIKRGKLEPYNSYGNGSAMRVSPVGWAYDNDATVALKARESAMCTHDHEEGIKGAQAVASSIHAARKGNDKEYIKKIVEEIGYDLSKKSYDFPQGEFDVTCQGTIPRCMAIFLETDDFESGMRKAVAMGGDVDTNCCIVGSICDAYYGLPNREIIEEVYARLPKQMTDIVTAFTKKYIDKDFEEPENIGSKASTFLDALQSLF
jgi:ADP-ribosylglycohydrolase